MSAEDGTPLQTSLLFDVFALNQAIGRLLDEAMRGGPLTPGDYAIASAIFALESATPSALALRLGMPLSTLMDHLARFEARGHARRMPNPADRRASLVVLTADGVAAHQSANRAYEAADAAVRRELAGGEAAPASGLARIRTAVERATSATLAASVPRATSAASARSNSRAASAAGAGSAAGATPPSGRLAG